MAKKTANPAIDFARLFAVKEQLARQSALEAARSEEPAVRESEGAGEGEVAPDVETAPLTSEVKPFAEVTETSAHVIAFPSLAVAESDRVIVPAISEMRVQSAEPALAEEAPVAEVSSDADVMLRIGMSRALHERLRAFAMLEGVTPTALARSLLDSRTPQFPREQPMAALAKAAREAFAPSGKRQRTEVRMQIGVNPALHRRLHQLAALRAQTLVASVSDLFEAAVPEM